MRPLVLAPVFFTLSATHARTQKAPAAQAGQPTTQRCNLEGYRLHLQNLQNVVASCLKQSNAANCDAALVGPDDEVATAAGTRAVGYAWVRNVLANAGSSATAKDKRKLQQAAENLREASDRLARELKSSGGPQIQTAGLTAAHRTLDHILSSAEFTRVKRTSFLDRVRDAFFQWVADHLSSLAAYGARTRWIARVFVAGSVLIAGTALLLWFNRQVRRQRAAVSPADSLPPEDDLALARKHSLAEARRLGREGRWREAIHSVYWAAISRMESKGRWPPDEARTPREYLDLVLHESERHANLASLTRVFERIWYGDSPAGEQEFQRACALFEKLVA